MSLIIKIPFLNYEDTFTDLQGKTIKKLFVDVQSSNITREVHEKHRGFWDTWFFVWDRVYFWHLLEIKEFEAQSGAGPIKPTRRIKMEELRDEFQAECGMGQQITSITIDIGK